MTEDSIRHILRSVLTSNFEISPQNFHWEQTLVELDPHFRILGYLMFLEQLLQSEFRTAVPLLENISTSVHTPDDIVKLIHKELELQ